MVMYDGGANLRRPPSYITIGLWWIAPMAQGLWTWWRQAPQTPRGGLKYSFHYACDLSWDTVRRASKYGRRLYCDHVTKCFVSKCVIQVVSFNSSIVIWDKHELGAKQYIATWMTHLETKHFSHMVTIQAATILALWGGRAKKKQKKTTTQTDIKKHKIYLSNIKPSNWQHCNEEL